MTCRTDRAADSLYCYPNQSHFEPCPNNELTPISSLGGERGGRGARQMVEEGAHFRRTHLLRVADVMEADEATGPVHVSLAQGGDVATGAQGVGEAIEQFRRTRGVRREFGRHPWNPSGRWLPKVMGSVYT